MRKRWSGGSSWRKRFGFGGGFKKRVGFGGGFKKRFGYGGRRSLNNTSNDEDQIIHEVKRPSEAPRHEWWKEAPDASTQPAPVGGGDFN